MSCPVCFTPLRQHLLQPNLLLIACPLEECVFPFNLLISELHERNLIQEITTAEVMNGMKEKMIQNGGVDPRIAEFLAKEDHDIL